MPTLAPVPAPAPFAAPPGAAMAARIIPPTEGERLSAFGDTIVFKLGGHDTGEALTLALGTVPPGGGPPPHRHLAEDELFIVLSGREEFLVNGAWTPVEPGTVVYLPRGTVHTFRNVGDVPSQHWVLTTPGGFDRFFRECAAVFDAAAASNGAPDMTRILAIFAAYQLELAT
jgi:quercetin dioxygenase-like cupin family protein